MTDIPMDKRHVMTSITGKGGAAYIWVTGAWEAKQIRNLIRALECQAIVLEEDVEAPSIEAVADTGPENTP